MAKKTKKKILKKKVTVQKKANPQKRVKPKLAKKASAAPASSTPKIGASLPAFSAASTSGTEFRLADQKGRKIVLYFYPKDATPGCTIEGHEFTKLLPEFQKLGVDVYGVSRDSIASHEKFKKKECFEFDLLSDPDEKLCKIFDVIKEKNMYGKKVLGVERSTFVIDSQGRLAAEWRKVKAEGHAQEVLNKLKEMA